MAQNGNRWRVPDRRYRSGYRWTPEGQRAIWKWTLLSAAWLLLVLSAAVTNSGLIPLAATVALVWYAVHRIRANHRISIRIGNVPPPRQVWAEPPPVQADRPVLRFNAPPGWPPPPLGWNPPPGWTIPPDWPPVPEGWQLWVPNDYVPDDDAPVGERRKRQAIPQDIKIAVAARDQGRCRCTAYPCHGHTSRCNSTRNLHYDHVIPWSGGGLDTVQNLQLLCGPCNLRKGADDIPA